jgi:hypothetical protein
MALTQEKKPTMFGRLFVDETEAVGDSPSYLIVALACSNSFFSSGSMTVAASP